MASSPEQLDALASVVRETIEVTRQLECALTEIESSPTFSPGVTDPLTLATDATRLVKAHATKISLLIINEPFTPTAVISVLRDLAAGPSPALAALAAAVQCVLPTRYTAAFRDQLAHRARRVLREVRELVEMIPRDGRVLPAEQRRRWAAGAPKGSMAATGTLWHACDDVVSLASGGAPAFLADEITGFRITLADFLREMKDWLADCDEELERMADMEKRGEDVDGYEAARNERDAAFDHDDEDDEEDEGKDDTSKDSDANTLVKDFGNLAVDDAQALVDRLLRESTYIPYRDPANIRPRLVSCLRRLRLVTLLYQSVAKRRLATAPLPNDGLARSRADDVVQMMRELRDRTQDLAEAFYNLDGPAIDALMDQCWQDAFSVAEMLGKSWDGGEDQFTEWAEKFKVEIRKS